MWRPTEQAHRDTRKVSLTLATKFHEDESHTNTHYAEACGVTVAELNELERTLLQILEYRLSVHPLEFDLYRRLAEWVSVHGIQRSGHVRDDSWSESAEFNTEAI